MDRICVVQADITGLAVDAIVNAANERMLGGGGVDGAIHRAAGPRLHAACKAMAEVRPGVRCPTGEARLTEGFDLPARYVIHTVGPVWRGGTHGEPEQLARAYRSCLEVASEERFGTVAFPAISCGVYGYPVEQAADVAVREIGAFLVVHRFPEEALLVAFDGTMARTLQERCGETHRGPGGTG